MDNYKFHSIAFKSISRKGTIIETELADNQDQMAIHYI
jgi:hypothetical protein